VLELGTTYNSMKSEFLKNNEFNLYLWKILSVCEEEKVGLFVVCMTAYISAVMQTTLCI